jgi:hypothetical protein
MRLFVVLIALGLSAGAYAQGVQPKAAAKPATQAKSHGPMGCKLVGTVRGTKLWAGDCMDATAPAAAPAETAPGQKQ